MSYEISLKMAWDELAALATESEYSVDFLADRYLVRLDEKSIILEPCGNAADEVAAVLVLHYLIGILKCGFHPCGEWISFKELRGGNVFWPAFSKSAIEPLAAYLQQNIRQNPRDSAAIAKTTNIQRMAKFIQDGSISLDIAAFPDIFVRVIFWKGDEELPCDATMLFDKGLAEIYGTEDIAVLLMRVAEQIIRRSLPIFIYLNCVDA
jgi:hypothetical protein